MSKITNRKPVDIVNLDRWISCKRLVNKVEAHGIGGDTPAEI